jgi:hypothetical protein
MFRDLDRTENSAFDLRTELFLKIIEPDQTDDSIVSLRQHRTGPDRAEHCRVQ